MSSEKFEYQDHIFSICMRVLVVLERATDKRDTKITLCKKQHSLLESNPVEARD